MNVWSIIEAIDDPSGLIHPEKHQALAQGTHPLGKHPAYPDFAAQPGNQAANYEEMLASEQWQKILQKANRYLGVPLTRQGMMTMQGKLLDALSVISEAEENYRDELQKLAIDLVFELPEFRSARQAYEAGQFRIEAELTGEVEGMSPGQLTSDDEEVEAQAQAPRQRTPAEEAWMKKMVQRRHFTNALIQGSAASNDYLFELGGATLNRIDPRLKNAYGVLMVATEIGYWIFPQSAVIAGARAQTHVGSSRVEIERPEPAEGENTEEEPGDQQQQPRPVVKAKGACLPVLIQEIIKGITEIPSLASLPRDPAEREEVIKQADLVDLETWSYLLGPRLWDRFIEATDAENERELAMHLYSHIQRLDVDEFNAFMKEVLGKTPRGMKMLRDLAARIKSELSEEGDVTESTLPTIAVAARQIVNHLVENDDDLTDWKDLNDTGRPQHRPQQGRYSQPSSSLPGGNVLNMVRRLGLGGTEIHSDGPVGFAVKIEFPEGSGQAPVYPRFITQEDALEFIAQVYAVVESRTH